MRSMANLRHELAQSEIGQLRFTMFTDEDISLEEKRIPNGSTWRPNDDQGMCVAYAFQISMDNIVTV